MHGKFGLLSPGNASSHSMALPSFFVFFFLCAVFLCFCNPPNSDMNYRIFNVRNFLCVHIHMGVGHTDNKSAQHFDSGKTLTNLSYATDRIRTSGHGTHWMSRPTLYQLSHHAPLCYCYLWIERLRSQLSGAVANTAVPFGTMTKVCMHANCTQAQTCMHANCTQAQTCTQTHALTLTHTCVHSHLRTLTHHM